MVLAPTHTDLDLVKERDASALISVGAILWDQLINIHTVLPTCNAEDLQCSLNTGLLPVNQPPC